MPISISVISLAVLVYLGVRDGKPSACPGRISGYPLGTIPYLGLLSNLSMLRGIRGNYRIVYNPKLSLPGIPYLLIP